MKSDAQPKFYKARPVPYSLQEAVEAEYSQLEAESIVEKVEFSEWATPMVHVPKWDGTTRSCKDYAVTVNPQLNVPQYPILLPEDVFVKLQGGQRFTELDLRAPISSFPWILTAKHLSQYPPRIIPLQETAFWYCFITCYIPVYHGCHSSRS